MQRACLASLAFAAMSALISILLSLALVAMRRALESARRGARRSLLEYAADTGAGFVLVVPPIVIGAGWFILARHFGDVFLLAPVHGRHGQRRDGDAVRGARDPAGP